MNLGTIIAAACAAIIATIGGIAALAFKSDKKWPLVEEGLSWLLGRACLVAFGAMYGSLFAWISPANGQAIFSGCIGLWIFAGLMFGAVKAANWLRPESEDQPDGR